MNSYDDANVMSRGLSINMPGLMKDVYAWMAIALLITGFTAYNVAQSPFLMSLLLGSRLSMWMLLIATVALVWHLSSSVSRMSLRAATTVFIVYSILNGLTMASVFIVYTMTSIASVFFCNGRYLRRDVCIWNAYQNRSVTHGQSLSDGPFRSDSCDRGEFLL